jgi:hypothetical protein
MRRLASKSRQLVQALVALNTYEPHPQPMIALTFQPNMKHRLRLTMALVASAIALGPISAHAFSKEDYWTGFATGVVSSYCSLQKEGLISRDYTKLFLQEFLKKDPKIPDSWREAVLKDSRSEYKDCSLPE